MYLGLPVKNENFGICLLFVLSIDLSLHIFEKYDSSQYRDLEHYEKKAKILFRKT